MADKNCETCFYQRGTTNYLTGKGNVNCAYPIRCTKKRMRPLSEDEIQMYKRMDCRGYSRVIKVPVEVEDDS